MVDVSLSRRGFVAAVAATAVFGVNRRSRAALNGVDWPGFRGPQRTGITSESGWVAKWPPKGPPVAWKKQIGIGFGSMSVAEGRVYASGNAERQEHVHCLNADTGDTVWRYSYPGALVNNLHEGGPGATPTIDAGKAHMLGREGQLHCFDAARGDVIWEADMKKLAGVDVPEWGFTSSGLIDGDLIIYQAGPLVALDNNSGKLAWKSKMHAPAYGSPVAFDLNGARHIAAINSNGLSIVDAKTGQEVAFTKWEAKYKTSACDPIVNGDKIFLSRGYDGGCGLYQFDGRNLKQLWGNKAMSNHLNSSVLLDGRLYGFDGNSNGGRRVALVCMDFATGSERWRKTGAETGLGCGSLIAADGKLICLGDQGKLAVIEADPSGFKQISEAQVIEDKCWTTPVLAQGRIYVRNAPGDLVCLDVRPPGTPGK